MERIKAISFNCGTMTVTVKFTNGIWVYPFSILKQCVILLRNTVKRKIKTSVLIEQLQKPLENKGLSE